MIKQVKELNLERAKALLGDKEISDERLTKVLEQVKAFCKVAYELYSKNEGRAESDNARELYAEPPDEFTNNC